MITLPLTVCAEIQIDLDVTVFSLGNPGYVAGPPELCDPPEPPEITYDVSPVAVLEAFRQWVDENWDQIEADVIRQVEEQSHVA